MRKPILVMLAGILASTCVIAAESVPAKKPVEKKPNSAAPVPAKAAKPAAKPKKSGKIQAEFSGYTSEISDQIYGRLNLTHKEGPVNWFIKGGYGLSKSRSYSGDIVRTTDVGTYTLDSQYRVDSKRSYRFASVNAKIRSRNPASSSYAPKTGYYMLALGSGRKVSPGLEAEVGLAALKTYDYELDGQVAVFNALRFTQPISSKVTFDADIYLLRPRGERALVDSRLDITHHFTPELGLQFTYVANNLLIPVKSPSGWDKSFRLSLVFTRDVK